MEGRKRRSRETLSRGPTHELAHVFMMHGPAKRSMRHFWSRESEAFYLLHCAGFRVPGMSSHRTKSFRFSEFPSSQADGRREGYASAADVRLRAVALL